MVFKDLPLIRIGHMRFKFGGTHTGPPNLIPFKTIMPYLRGQMGWFIGTINLLGNVVLLVPIGFLMRIDFPKMRWPMALVIAFATGLAIEGMQEVFQVGIFDIDDVTLNALGVMVGFWIKGKKK